METLDVFEVLVREHSGMLTAFLNAALPRSAVDDVWQETMLTAWRRWDDFDQKRPFGAWLRGIATRNVLAWQRKSIKAHVACDQATLEYFAETFARMHALPGDTFDEKLSALRHCIEALPEEYEQTIRMRYEEELKPADVAQRLDRKTETIKKQLLRAKAQLLDCITRRMAAAAPQS